MAHNHTSKGVHSNSSPKKQPAALLRQFQAVFLRPDILHSELQAWFRTHDHNRACGLTKPTQRMTMTAPKKNLIHAAIGLTHFSDGVVSPKLDASLNGLEAHADIYSKPPVDLTTYGGAITSFKNSIPAALDGSKAAIALKNKLRTAAINMYRQLAHYVEANCNNDIATFLLSGFQAKAFTKTPTPATSESIRKLQHATNSGQVNITPMRYKGAPAYDIRWAPVPPGGAPSNWASQTVAGVRPPTTIAGLTPGTTYAFQVRALTKNGYTDWSDSVTIICI